MAKTEKSPFKKDGELRFTDLEVPNRKMTKEHKKLAVEFMKLLNDNSNCKGLC